MYTFTKLHDMRIPNVGVGVRVGPMEFQLNATHTAKNFKATPFANRLPSFGFLTFHSSREDCQCVNVELRDVQKNKTLE